MLAGKTETGTGASGGLTRLSERDRQELIDLIVDFAWRVDHRSADTIHELVTEDVFIEMAYGPMVGKDAVKAWGKDRAVEERRTRHVMTNFRFQVVDGDRVEGSSMSLIFRHDGSEVGPALPWAVTECTDVFVRQDGVWKFASHVTTDIFFSG
ncbi:MAG: nuclear transport factor 2 family protein [Chloroflexota bacterium]|nr:nuclear transport factor 2 family protein [Chloroflexota bacterium]